MRKALPQKNTLLKTAASQSCKPKFLREYFFLQPKKKFNFFSPTLRCLIFFSNRTVHNPTDIALKVNRFEQSVCGLRTIQLRTESKAAGNKKINAIKKRRGLSGNQTVVHLMECLQVQKMRTTLRQRSLFICSHFLREVYRSESLLFFTASIPSASNCVETHIILLETILRKS